MAFHCAQSFIQLYIQQDKFSTSMVVIQKQMAESSRGLISLVSDFMIQLCMSQINTHCKFIPPPNSFPF